MGPSSRQVGSQMGHDGAKMGHDSAKMGHDSAKMGHDNAKIGILSSTLELQGQSWEHFSRKRETLKHLGLGFVCTFGWLRKGG